MDIAIITPYRFENASELSGPGQSALNWYTRQLAQALIAVGAGVKIIGPKPADRKALPWDDGAIRVLPTYVRGAGRAWIDIASGVGTAKPDVVHLEHELFAYGGVLNAFTIPFALQRIQRRGLTVLTTIHGVIPLNQVDAEFVRANRIPAAPTIVRSLWRSLLRRVAAASDLIHVHEPQQAHLLNAQYGIDERRIRVIPIGVSAGLVVNGRWARNQLSIPDDAKVALFFGYLSSYKGVAEFIRDVPLMLGADPRVHVVIAGEVPARLRGAFDLDAALYNSGVDVSRIRTLGFVPDDQVSTVFSAADVLVLPYTISMSASGPMSLALAHGVPALLSSVCAENYLNAPGTFPLKQGYIADSVIRFFRDEQFQNQCVSYWQGCAAKRSWEYVAAEFMSLYATLRGPIELE